MSAVLSYLFVPYAPPLLAGASVVVTGCDTGFGRLLAVRLTALGYRVFASCFTDDGPRALAEETRGAANLTTFRLDVTKQEEIDAAARLIAAHCPDGLNALVNNAGTVSGWRIDWSSPDDFRRTMDVNFHGMVGMVLALMPLLRRAKAARIVNVSSAAGYLASPFMGPYVASKHAIEGFSDVLRIELRELRIPVCVIEPTFHRTNLISNMDKVIENTFRSAPKETQDFYGEEYAAATKRLLATRLKLGRDPQLTVDCMIAALTDSHPGHRYRVGLGAKSAFLLLNKLPTFWSDRIVAMPVTTLLPKPKAML